MPGDYLSQEKYDELSAELETLKTTRRREVASRLEFAKSLGDLAENAEYHSAREEQSELEDRINQLEVLLKNAQIISSRRSGEVDVGSVVTLKKVGESRPVNFTIVGSEEADMTAGKLSYQSPLGASLLGQKKGSTVTVATPRGQVEYKIMDLK